MVIYSSLSRCELPRTLELPIALEGLSKDILLIVKAGLVLSARKISTQNLLLHSLYYAEACNELGGPISASLRPGHTGPFEEMLQRWRTVGNTVPHLTNPKFEPQTSRSRNERVTARATGQAVTRSSLER